MKDSTEQPYVGESAARESTAEGAPRESFPLTIDEDSDGHVERLLTASHVTEPADARTDVVAIEGEE